MSPLQGQGRYVLDTMFYLNAKTNVIPSLPRDLDALGQAAAAPDVRRDPSTTLA